MIHQNARTVDGKIMAKVSYQGRQVEATPVDFRIEKEDWNEYQLLDGSVLRLRVVLSDVFRVIDEWDVEGNPIYVTKSGNVLVIRATEELKKH